MKHDQRCEAMLFPDNPHQLCRCEERRLRAASAYIGPVDGPRAGSGNDDERKAAARIVEVALNTVALLRRPDGKLGE